MTLVARRYGPHLFATVALLAAVGCGDQAATPPNGRQLAPTNQAARTILDGAHGGNPEVFFLPPMVGNPNGVATFNTTFQPGLPASVVITDQTPGNSFTPIAMPMQVDPTNQFYQLNWDTKATPLSLTDTYRINIEVGSKIIAFADVVLGSNGSTLKNVDSQSYIGLVDGRTLPIKVRINQGWGCLNRNSCVTQVVPNPVPNGQTIIVVSNDGLNSAAFSGNWAGTVPFVVITLENVTDQLSKANGGPGCSLGVTNMVSIEHCVRITADPSVRLTAPVQVGTCMQNIGDHRQLLLKYDLNETPHFLTDEPPPHPCPAGYSMGKPSSNPLVRLASAALDHVGRGIGWAMGLKTAYAFDVGVGGTIGVGDGFSLLAPGFPADMSIVEGNGQSAAVSSVLPTAAIVRVSALHDVGEGQLSAAVIGEHLTCTATTTGAGVQSGDGFAASASATDNGDGTYTCPAFRLSGTAGANTFSVTASNLDANVVLEAADGEQTTLPGTITFTETGAAGPAAPNIVSVDLTSTNATIDQGGVQFTVTVNNPTNTTYKGVTLQTFVTQGNTNRTADPVLIGGTGPQVQQVLCGDGSPGVLPGGATCVVQFLTFMANDQVESGTGTFAPGPANFQVVLGQQALQVQFDQKTSAINLVPVIP